MVKLRQELHSRGIVTFTFDDVPVPEALREELSGIISLVEQVVCMYSLNFYGTLPSTWDEMVYHIRQLLVLPQTKKQRQKEWMLYVSKIRRLYSYRRYRYWRRDKSRYYPKQH